MDPKASPFGPALPEISAVKFTRVDPKTGTVVEFKGLMVPKSDMTSPTPKLQDLRMTSSTLVGRAAGKVSEGGRQRGNIPYSGPPHPSSSGRQTGNVDPH